MKLQPGQQTVVMVAVITFLLTITNGKAVLFTDNIAAFWKKVIG